MVQLKVFSVASIIIYFMFQFLMVQLKGQEIITVYKIFLMFQFLMVQLKALRLSNL